MTYFRKSCFTIPAAAVVVALCVGTLARAQDSDGDGFPDASDNCPQIANADQADCDSDGVGNVCEIAGGASDSNCNRVPDECETSWGDFDLSGEVAGDDLGYLLGMWGTTDPLGDFDHNGQVDGADLAYVLLRWGTTPFPQQALPWATTLECYPDPAVVTNTSLVDAIAATGLPWRVRDNASNIEMLLVPPGTFMMGCSASDSAGCLNWENPVHQVTLTHASYMGRTEVTQLQWQTEMGSNPSFFVGYTDSPSRPVEQVSWNMSREFVAQNGLRLPTEAEWEFAYRAGTTTAFHSMPGYPNGANADDQVTNIAWCLGNAGSQTHAVAGKAPNALGLHDMAGNVMEWVNDWYGNSYYGESPATNPLGPESGSYRIFRGGGWWYAASYSRASARTYNTSDVAYFTIGFRVARTP